MSKFKIRVHESNSNVPEDALTTVLVGMFQPGDGEILAGKGFQNPTDKEKALWVAYGLFNDIERVHDKFAISLYEFQRVVDEFIGNNGGWDYFPID